MKSPAAGGVGLMVAIGPPLQDAVLMWSKGFGVFTPEIYINSDTLNQHAAIVQLTV